MLSLSAQICSPLSRRTIHVQWALASLPVLCGALDFRRARLHRPDLARRRIGGRRQCARQLPTGFGGSACRRSVCSGRARRPVFRNCSILAILVVTRSSIRIWRYRLFASVAASADSNVMAARRPDRREHHHRDHGLFQPCSSPLSARLRSKGMRLSFKSLRSPSWCRSASAGAPPMPGR